MNIVSRLDFGKARRAVDAGTERALGTAAEHLLTDAQPHEPLEEGTLSRSGSTSVDAGAGEAVVSYDTAYAIRLHENPQYNFKHGREGKWLQHAVDRNGDRIASYLADAMRAEL